VLTVVEENFLGHLLAGLGLWGVLMLTFPEMLLNVSVLSSVELLSILLPTS
jgi:hypothetical protein